MKTMLFVRHPVPKGSHHRFRAMGMSVVMALIVSGMVQAQGPQIAVSGTVTATGGFPLRGVTIRVQGTDLDGWYSA